MRREFWNKAISILSRVLIVAGVLLLLGAAGESDMYGEMGKYLPLMVTIKKMVIGLLMLAVGTTILNNEGDE